MNYIDKLGSLPPHTVKIVAEKQTEFPHSGIYNEICATGTYLCRRCGLALFRASSQFSSGCGWPSFDDSISENVRFEPDADGLRTEIICQRCLAHLGHIFKGEQLTQKNTRYCVNSASLDFVTSPTVLDSEEAIVAGGCFWGIEYYLSRLKGVLKTEVGYIGGSTLEPTYHQVCQGDTGHYEAVRILFDPNKTNYQLIIKHFFEIHDPSQSNGQGPDIGLQYQSAVFYFNDVQKEITKRLIEQLETSGVRAATKLLSITPFWRAEDFHQAYYQKQNKVPYCHKPIKRF